MTWSHNISATTSQPSTRDGWGTISGKLVLSDGAKDSIIRGGGEECLHIASELVEVYQHATTREWKFICRECGYNAHSLSTFYRHIVHLKLESEKDPEAETSWLDHGTSVWMDMGGNR